MGKNRSLSSDIRIFFIIFQRFWIFSHVYGFFDNPLVISPERQKHTDFAPTLEPTTARYTRTFSTIWVPIDFYFFRRIQKKQNLVFLRHLSGIFLTI